MQLSAQKIGLFFRKLLFEESSGDRIFLVCHLFGCAKSHDISAISPPFRTKVNDIIGALYHIHIVIGGDYGISFLDQFFKHRKQYLNIFEIGGGGRYGWTLKKERTWQVKWLRRKKVHLNMYRCLIKKRKGNVINDITKGTKQWKK